MSSATWSARGRASLLIAMISSWIASGWPASSFSSWVLLPAEEGPDRGGDRRRGPDHCIGLLVRSALEVAVDQGLHRRQQ
jgi:hypothetical protein